MLQISDEDLTIIEKQAFSLAQAAIRLDQARTDNSGDNRLVQALENNLQLWVEVGTLVRSPESQLATNVRDNILKLRDFIAHMTMQHGINIPETTLNTLININFQISEGLLEGVKNRNAY